MDGQRVAHTVGPVLPRHSGNVLQRGSLPPAKPEGDIRTLAEGQSNSRVEAVCQVWEHESSGNITFSAGDNFVKVLTGGE